MDNPFEMAFKFSEDGILIADENNLVVHCNPAISRITGFNKDEIVGKYLCELTLMLLPEKRKQSFSKNELAEKLEKYQKTGKGDWLHKLIQSEIQTKNGDIRKIEELNVPVETSSGYMTISYKRDVTEKWLREKKLSENTKIYTDIFRFAYDAIFIMKENKFIDCNERTAYIFGLENKKDILDHHPSDFSPLYQPDGLPSRTKADKLIEKTLSGEPQRFFWVHKRLDGKEFDTEVTLSRISKKEKLVLAIVRDISFQRVTEEQIKKLYQTVEQSPVSIILTDTDGNIEYVNPWFTKITGYTLEEIKGENPRILKSGETSIKEYEILWQTILSGNVWRGEFHNKKKNGELYWESAVISPIKDSNGNITNFVGIKEDITELKKLQRQLMLAQRIESIGTLTTGIAHDFNNILTAISGYTELVKMNLNEDSNIYGDILAIEESAKKASELIRQLLTFSRKQHINPKPVNINSSIEAILKMLKRMIGEDISIEKKLESDIWPIIADPSQLDQILINLTVNARDAMEGLETQKKIIKIKTENVVIDNNYVPNHPGSYTGEFVRLTISDNGKGIPEGIRDRIFDPFFSTKTKDRGTGMGLATVYGIVKQNKGFIYVYSEHGKGTIFKIFWPVARKINTNNDSIVHQKPSKKGSETIILVEDDPSVKGFAEKALKSLGYQVYSFENGIDTLNYIKRNQFIPDLIITDIIMPGMGGLELYNSIKNIYGNIPFIFTSGYTDVAIKKDLENAVINKFIEKPYSIAFLTSEIRRLLDLRNEL